VAGRVAGACTKRSSRDATSCVAGEISPESVHPPTVDRVSIGDPHRETGAITHGTGDESIGVCLRTTTVARVSRPLDPTLAAREQTPWAAFVCLCWQW
jgi:hypothetical protein